MRRHAFIRLVFLSLLATELTRCTRSGNAPHPPATEPTTVVTSQPGGEVDAAVVGRVLEDLVTNLSDENPVAPRGTLLETIPFSRESATWKQTVDMVLYEHEPRRWQRLTEPQRAAVREAAGQLVARTLTAPQHLELHDVPKPITVIDKPATTDGAERGPPGVFERPIRAWLPGYSDDQSVAVVRLSIPWSIHHAEATYVLQRADGKWAVLLRQFVYYL